MKTKFNILALVVISLLISHSSYAQRNLKIVSYNVLFGLQKDSVNVDRFVSFIKDWNPDIVALQEMNGFTQKTLEKLGERVNHPYVLQSKEEGFPVAITSIYPLVNFKKVTENMWHSFIYTKIEGLHIFVIHFSPFSYQKRLQEVKNIIAQTKEISKDEPILIMGDFNSMDESDSASYDQEMVLGMIEREKKEAHIRNLNNHKIDYSVLGELKKAGFVDTYRLINNNFESSLPTLKDGNTKIHSTKIGKGKRIDFIWANSTAKKLVVKSGIIKNEYTDYISDHYPTFLEIKLP